MRAKNSIPQDYRLMAHTRYIELAQGAPFGALLLLSVGCAMKPV